MSIISLENRKLLDKRSEHAVKDEDLTREINLMFGIMNKNNGIGLAANQVGLNKRVIVVNVNGFQQELINPIITNRLGRTVFSSEACLSFPGSIRRIERHKQIIVEGFDARWNPIKRKLKGVAAFCVQHEIDHLDGITIVDKR